AARRLLAEPGRAPPKTPARPEDEIPAVPREQPPDVDADARQREGREHTCPPDASTEAMTRDGMQEVERREPCEHARPGEARDEDGVEPERRRGRRSQVHEVGR